MTSEGNGIEHSALNSLTKRELEVLHLIARGLTYKQAAQQLYVTPETVKMHLKNIYAKLNVNNKVEAINHLRR